MMCLTGGILNGSDIVGRTTVPRSARRAIPFSGEEMRRRARTERAEFAHEMRLVGIAIGEREVRPGERRSHDRLPPGPGKTRQSLETFRRHADVREKAAMQLARR